MQASTGLVRQCRGCAFEFEADERERNTRLWCSAACRVRFHRTGVRLEHPHPRAEEVAPRETPTGRICGCGHAAPHGKGPAPAECPLCRAAVKRRECAMCGREFEARASNGRFCSRRCKIRSSRNGRTRRLPAARPRSYDGASVFQRSSWVCALCGKPVDRCREWPDPRCGTVDHRVPVSAGGSDDPDNLRVAHWDCNRASRSTNQGLTATV